MISRIIFRDQDGLRWRDAPKDYGPRKDGLQPLHPLETPGCVIRTLETLTPNRAAAGRRDKPLSIT